MAPTRKSYVGNLNRCIPDTRSEWLGEELLFKLDSNKCWKAQMQQIFEPFSGPLLKSGVGPLARYGSNQQTISRRPEQMYTSSDTRLEWLGDGPLFESDSNIRQGGQNGATIRVIPGPLFMSGLGSLAR